MDQWILCSVSGERLLSVVDIADNGVVCTGGRRGGTTDAPILCCSDSLLLQSSASPQLISEHAALRDYYCTSTVLLNDELLRGATPKLILVPSLR